MNLQKRIKLFSRLGEYLSSNEPAWILAKERAFRENAWFIPEFIDLSVNAIADCFLKPSILEEWMQSYQVPEENQHPRTVGIVMAGNIPLVGFHDLLSVLMTGHRARIKPSSKDETLIRHLVTKLCEWEPGMQDLISFETMLKGCDAYIATGSNNSSGFFEYYFSKYPHIIRRNRTSVAVLTGNETAEELLALADDVHFYFGLGCRNVTKIYVPRNYDFLPMLAAFRKYNYLIDQNKYKNNYDYNLAILILNKELYMTNESLLLVENESVFSPISQLNYEYYEDRESLKQRLNGHPDLQGVVGHGFIPFGQSQRPGIRDYADGVDTVGFLLSG